MSKVYECIIIGGGPSGLAAGNILAQAGMDFLIIDKGDYLYKRNPEIPNDIVAGIGGGGLFSDGKVSFFPSGSNLYKLDPKLLKRAYQELSDMFNLFSINIPKFDPDWLTQENKHENLKTITNKHYESYVLSQEQLYRIGFYLYDQIGKKRFRVKHDVIKITQDKREYNVKPSDDTNTTWDQITYSIEVKNIESGANVTIRTKNIIFCGGKFGSLSLESLLNTENLVFKKYEYGIRIETDHEHFDYKEFQQTDLKILIPNDENEKLHFRTFCFCRNGYIVHGKFEELNSFNGVSNKHDFDKTNFGINLRITDETVFKSLKNELSELQKSESIIKQSIKEFIDKKNQNWSDELYLPIQKCLKTYFPKICNSDAEITGPSFEYFGYYPNLNLELKLPNGNIWICGDSTGDFRGLMPSLTSGFLAAFSLVDKESKEKELLYDLVRIKPSPTKINKTIFAAQSKKVFYCKDAICEFIFKERCIPINPFQVFGYFLNDRVERDLVRNGNNELISRCDELWVFGPIADGVLFEISIAFQLKIPVRFFTVGALQVEIKEITDITKLVFEPEVHAQIGRDNLIRFISQCYEDEPPQPQPQLKLGFDELNRK